MKNLIEDIKQWYEKSNCAYHEHQQKIAHAMATTQAAQQQQYNDYIHKQLRRFFRLTLNQMSEFDTTCMRCDVIDQRNNDYRLWLQIPSNAQCQNVSNKALAQMIEELLSAECDQRLHNLEVKAYQLQMLCTSPEDIFKYNGIVDESVCYFMHYCVKKVKTNAFKADIVIDAVIDVCLLQSYYL